ncbi:MAG TPA: FAD-dependent oxidoreductase [Phycisphaerales bacterium]
MHERNDSSHTSGVTTPVWYADARVPQRGRLERDAHADVCVVGAGIAGITVAYLLARHGKSVIVLDEKPVAGGETGRTSAHLASAIDDRFVHIERHLGADAARIQYESHAAAIDFIERVVREEGIECGFARLDGLLFQDALRSGPALDEECAAARRAGFLGVELQGRAPTIGFAAAPCLRFPRQARFHPLQYIVQLAAVAEKLGVRICCGTRVMDLTGDDGVVAKLADGVRVTANFGVAATNVPSPINNWMGVYTKQVAYRTFMISLELPRGGVTDALYWDTADPYHFVRVHKTIRDGKESEMLLVGGEDHRVGVAEESDAQPHAAFDRLERWAREHFMPERGLGKVVDRWSGQVVEPNDGVAFIGRVPSSGHSACFVITGDSGMGLTGGTLGALLVCDLIVRGGPGRRDEQVNRWATLYSPTRKPFHSLGTAVEFAKENAAAAGHFLDYLKKSERSRPEEIPLGSGAVLNRGTHKIACYRDEKGRVHECSAVCTHLKCVVHWNQIEKSWDCPCHGSRFDAFGKVLMGPAIDDLPPVASTSGASTNAS